MRFIGEPVLHPLKGKLRGEMVFCYDWGYIDKKGKDWWALRGDVINGASIPRWGQSLVGSPYTGRYAFAAYLHDCAYTRHQDTQKACDKMFLCVMEYTKTPLWKRRLFYRMVRDFGASAYKDRNPLDVNRLDLVPEWITDPSDKGIKSKNDKGLLYQYRKEIMLMGDD